MRTISWPKLTDVPVPENSSSPQYSKEKYLPSRPDVFILTNDLVFAVGQIILQQGLTTTIFFPVLKMLG